MKTIFITATNTDVGKTYTTVKLASYYHKQGYRVGVFKPIETGVKELPQDGVKLLKASRNPKLNLDDVIPVRFSLPAAPYVAKKDEKIDFEKIKNSYEKIKAQSDIVLVEGAGGLLTPVEENFFMVDFIEFLRVDKTLLISPNSLGCINDTLLSQNLLKQRGIDFVWAVNELRESREEFEKVTLPFFKDVVYTSEINSWLSKHLL